MVRCEGRKGAALHRYNERMKATRDIVKGMPYKDKSIIAAVFADGKSYRISGCQGMQPVPEFVRIVGKDADGYKVVWENSNEVVEISKSELSAKLDSYYDVRCSSNEKSEESREEDR